MILNSFTVQGSEADAGKCSIRSNGQRIQKTKGNELMTEIVNNDSELCEKIEAYIISKHEVSLDGFKSKSRKKELVYVRHLIFFFQYYFTEATLKYIGNRCGDRDHSTVIHGKNSVSDHMEINEKFCRKIKQHSKELFGDDHEKLWRGYEAQRKAEVTFERAKKRFSYRWEFPLTVNN
jgi:hypothetical protein